MLKRCLPLLLAIVVATSAVAQTKKRVEREADLPRFTYKIEGKLEDLVRDPAKFARFAAEVRRDNQSVLDTHDIADKASQRSLMGVLAIIDFLEGRYAEAAKRSAEIRALEDKPANTLISGMQLRSMVAAQEKVGNITSPEYRAEVGRLIVRAGVVVDRIDVGGGFPSRYSNEEPTPLKDFMTGVAGLRRDGSAALDLAYVACGRYDGFWEMSLSSWDVAAGSLIVQEAGGVVTDFDGRPGYIDSGDIIAALAATEFIGARGQYSFGSERGDWRFHHFLGAPLTIIQYLEVGQTPDEAAILSPDEWATIRDQQFYTP